MDTLPSSGTHIAETYHSTLSKIKVNDTLAVLKCYRRRDDRATSQFAKEVSILQSLSSHPNITTIISSDTENRTITLAYSPGRTLDEFIDPISLNCTLSQNEGEKIQLQMAKALSFIHDEGIFHDDVKPDNILYDPASQNAVLVDFGAALRVPKDAGGEVEFNPSGTPPYAPPEFLEKRKSIKGDIWALGVTMLFVIGCIKLPDGNWLLPAVFEDAVVRKEMEEWLEEVEGWRKKAITGEIDELLGEMLESDPDRRIRSKALVQRILEKI
ncbi:Obscurin [Arthrobotrys entomopaga]|nr:Obscurin [Arthrobotrys entomopaga]